MSFIITVKGEAKTDYPNLEELDGIDCQDDFTEYFNNYSFKKNVKSGYLEFKFEDNKLYAITKYTSDRELNNQELRTLLEYTTGQWSDGIGEGFEQEPCYYSPNPFNKYDPNFDDYENQEAADRDREVFISPWFPGQKAVISQNKLNN